MLRLHPRLAPYKVAVLPLSKKDTLTPLAKEVYATLAERYMCDYDETQAIGRRYRRQDEIGTPLCVTVDFDSLDDHAVTDPRARHHRPGAGPHRSLLDRGHAPPRLLSRPGEAQRRETEPQAGAAARGDAGTDLAAHRVDELADDRQTEAARASRAAAANGPT